MKITTFLLGTLLAASSVVRADLSIDSVTPGQAVRYPVVIVTGTADGDEMAIGTSWSQAIRFPIVRHRFVSFVVLKPGKNMVLLHAGAETMKFRLDFLPATTATRISAVLVSGSDSPLQNSSANATVRKKLDVELKLLQGFTADAMRRASYDRNSFCLDCDRLGEVNIHSIRSTKTTEELQRMDVRTLREHLLSLIHDRLPKSANKFLCILDRENESLPEADSDMCFISKQQSKWWPESYRKVPKTFANSSTFVPYKLNDGRTATRSLGLEVSASYANTLLRISAMLGIIPSVDTNCVFSKGFDQISRCFTAFEPTTLSISGQIPKAIPGFDPYSAAVLNTSPLFKSNSKGAFLGSMSPVLRIENGNLVVESQAGIRLIAAVAPESTPWLQEHKEDNLPKSLSIPLKEVRSKLDGANRKLQFIAIDNLGGRTVLEDRT